ncbi:hypothetical protein KAR91_65315, partial [Candidatus Pacearchaeota archaeon]|nr:hypothetical protein [Candidatus Pacearchaeota archaeon]
HFIEEIRRLNRTRGDRNIYSIVVSTGFDREGNPILGKGNNFRNLFELLWIAKQEGSLKGAVVIDADLRTELRNGVEEGITKEWIKRFLYPVIYPEECDLKEAAEFVSPVYSRHEYDGSLTNNFITQIMNLVQGSFVRQPIGGDFGFSPRTLEKFLLDMEWSQNTRQYGIDISMSLTVALNNLKLVETVLGSKIHAPSAPKLGRMIPEVFGGAVGMLSKNKDRWKNVGKKEKVHRIVDGKITPPQKLNVNYMQYKDGFLGTLSKEATIKDDFLSANEIIRRAATWGLDPNDMRMVLAVEDKPLQDRFLEDKEILEELKNRGDFVIVPDTGSSDKSRSVYQASSPISDFKEVGGIDLNEVNVNRQGAGVDIQFDPIQVQEMIDMGVTGFAPVIINLVPLPSILPLLGLDPRKEEEEFELSQMN